MVAISLHATPEELKKIVQKDKYTRMPVYEKNLDKKIVLIVTWHYDTGPFDRMQRRS